MKEERYWEKVAEKAAARFFQQNPGTPEIAIRKGERVICLSFDLPDIHADLFAWLCTQLDEEGVIQVAHAVHPPAGEENDRRAHALLLDPNGQDWDLIEFLVGLAVLRSEERASSGQTHEGEALPSNSARRRARRQKRRVPNRRRRMCVRSLIRQARSEPAVFMLD